MGYSTGGASQGVVGTVRDDNFHLSPPKNNNNAAAESSARDSRKVTVLSVPPADWLLFFEKGKCLICSTETSCMWELFLVQSIEKQNGGETDAQKV